MKKQKAKISRLSRNTKTILYALGIVLLALLGYLALGCPSLTPKMAFRRAEKANLLGPSTILGTEKDPGLFYGKSWHMILAETDQSCMLYTCFDGESSYNLYCAEKTGDATVLFPSLHQYVDDPDAPLPRVAVFDDIPDAKSARMEVTEKGSHLFYYSIYTADRRTHPGYFVLRSNGQYAASEIRDSRAGSVSSENNITVVRITVIFYGEDGTRIAERSFDYSEDGTQIAIRSFDY